MATWEETVICSCGEEFVWHDVWETLDDVVPCPKCGKMWALEYFEDVDPATGYDDIPAVKLVEV